MHGAPLKMKNLLMVILTVLLRFPDGLLRDTNAMDSHPILPTDSKINVTTDNYCFRNFAGSVMTCRGTLPSFSNESFAQLSQVDQLDVLKCHFDHVPKSAFQGMLGLRSLLINCNNEGGKLTIAQDALEDLRNLQLLSLNQNNIRKLPPNFICYAPALEHVFLWRNLLTSVDDLGLDSTCNSSAAVHGCGQAIQTFVLKKNFIEHLPGHALCTLKNLTRLDLSQNRISRIDRDAFSNLKSLLNLDLSENNLTVIPEEVGRSLKQLLILNLGNNPLLEDVTTLLKHCNRLERLNLTNTGNAMRAAMKGDSFRFYERLYILILNENAIAEINETIFEPTARGPQDASDFDTYCHGGHIMAIYNELEDPRVPLDLIAAYISNADVSRGSGLRYLSLDANNFDKFPAAVKVLLKLQILSLRRNRIKSLSDDDFQNLRVLHLLHLSFNGIESISDMVFFNLSCLVQLHLDHNEIRTLNSTAFDGNEGLLEVFLQHNKISSIDGMFLHNRNLKTLDLSNNLLTTVGIDYLPLSLVDLNLSHNRLMIMSPSRHSFPMHLGMETLDLSNNQITHIDRGSFPVSLVDLYLNDNNISSVGNCTFCAISKLRQLILNDNQLKSAQPEWFQVNSRNPSAMAIVYLQGNSFVCDCKMKTFANAVAGNQMAISRVDKAANLRCQPEFSKVPKGSISIFSTTSPEDFLCRSDHTLNASLPERCNIYHDSLWNFVIGDCSNANMTSVPSSIPPNVLYLYFDGNNIKRISGTTFNRTVHIQRLFLNNSRIFQIEDGAFRMLKNLKVLHLENNFLHFVSGGTFLGLSRLTELYLSFNRIDRMDVDAFQPLVSIEILEMNDNRLTMFPVWELSSLENLAELQLSENPWSCECDYLKRYREWLQKYASKVHDVKTLFCSYGDNTTSDIPIIADTGSNCFGSQSFLESKYFPLTTCLSALALFIIVSGSLLFTYRDEIRVIVYHRYGLRLFASDDNDKDMEENKIYDAFVCYSHDDEVFVTQELIPGLEGIDPPFRLCVHSRDFVIGSFITDNILEAVEHSRRTILILSEHFIRSEWCRFEFKTAHLQMFRDPSHRVILIVRGVIPKQLHPELKVYLKTNTYLMWDDRLFWERLYYAMPDRPALTMVNTNAT